MINLSVNKGIWRIWLCPLCTLIWGIYRHWWDPSKSSLLQNKQLQFSQILIIGKVIHSLHHPCGLTSDFLQYVHVSITLRGSELDTVLQMWTHQERVEGDDHLPWPAGHGLFNALHDTTGLLGYKSALLTLAEPVFCQNSQVLLPGAPLQKVIP